MDWPCSSSIVDCFLLYSLGLYCFEKYYRIWYRCNWYYIWQTRIFSFFMCFLFPVVSFYSSYLGKTIKPASGGIKYGMGIAKFLYDCCLLWWRMSRKKNRALPRFAFFITYVSFYFFPRYEDDC